MKGSKSYRRFSIEEKLSIVQAIRLGKSVSSVAKSEAISRTIIYKWLFLAAQGEEIGGARYFSQAPQRRKKGKKATPVTLERKIKKLALKNPTYSIRYIAKQGGVSVGCAWSILHKKDLTTTNGRIRHLNAHGGRLVHISTLNERVAMLRRFEAGDPISAICRDFQVSRTIFYRWLRSYRQSGRSIEALHDRRPRDEKHWRYKKGISRHVLVLIEEYPELSVRQLQDIFTDDTGRAISTSGLYYILRRLGLTTYEDRLRYAKSPKDVSRVANTLIERKLTELSVFSLKSALSPPRLFASPNLAFSLFVSFFTIFFSLSVLTQPSGQVSPTTSQAGQNHSKNIMTLGSVIKSLSTNVPVEYKENFGSEQDMKWGALAVNSAKDVYLPHESAEISFGIVDDQGVTVCDADISLAVKHPDHKQSVFTTQNGQINASTACANGVYSSENDYSVSFPVESGGAYHLSVNAATENGAKGQEYVLQVVTGAPFIVNRSGFPSRVYPLHEYPVEIDVVAKEDYRGKVVEVMHSAMNVEKISGGGVVNEVGSQKTISWDVAWKKGNTYTLSYMVHFPSKSPEYYLFGPLRIGSYQEQRAWQSAVDSIPQGALPVLGNNSALDK